jgi:hypothetical protein
MAIFIPPSRRKPIGQRQVTKTYSSFRRGVDTFLLDSELNDEELRETTNLKLVGKGILQSRPGSANYYLSNAGNTVRHITEFYLNSTLELLQIGDDGFLTKKSGTSYSKINGASFPSGSRPESVQIYGKRYFVDGIGVRPLTRYDGTTLLSYTTLISPTSLTATKSSGTSGGFTYSWRVAAEGDVGSTLASDPVTLGSLPLDLTTVNFVTLNWVAASPLSSVRGYIIFGREQGAQSYMSRVPAGITTWIDDGSIVPSISVFPEASNTTGGPIARHIAIYKEKLLLANLIDDASTFEWSGSGPNIDRFHYSVGGGYYSIEKNSQDRLGITGLSEREGKIIVFKGQSIYQVTLTYNSSLGINEATVSKLVSGVGCIAGKTVQEVENSVMFVSYIPGRGLALAKLDYEPNILSPVLRFQPISARVQSIVDQVNFARIEQTHAVYFDKKYHWFIPVGSNSWQTLVYDVERLAFEGPWSSASSSLVFSNSWSAFVHLDSGYSYHMLVGKNDGNVVEVSDQYSSDEGTNFTWTALTKRDDFGKPFQLKTIIDAKTKLRNVSGGSVTVSYLVEGKNGLSTTAKSVTVVPTTTLAGWGSRRWGFNSRFGYMPSSSVTNSNITVKYSLLNKPNILSVQIQYSGTGSNAQIISSEIRAREMSPANIPSTWR